ITGTEPACLPIASNINPDGSAPGPIAVPENRGRLLEAYGSNMQLFAMICATSIGFNALDPSACGQSVFNSSKDLLTQSFNVPRSDAKTVPTIASGLANVLAGGNTLAAVVVSTLAGVPAPTVPLNADPCDAFLSNGDGTCGPEPGRAPHIAFAGSGLTLNQVLTDEQEALLGCGPFWGTDCEGDGIDLLNADAGVLQQSWIGFEGFYSEAYQKSGFKDWHMANGEPQPGTIGFVQRGSSLPAARYFNDQLVQVPGTRSPFLQDGVTPNPAYNVNQDGSIDGLVLPPEFGASAGQQFVSEMAALSYNLMLTLVAF